MSHPHLPAAEERTAEAQRSNNPQNDAFVGGSPWSRIIRVKDYSETLTLPGSDLLVTPRTGHFEQWKIQDVVKIFFISSREILREINLGVGTANGWRFFLLVILLPMKIPQPMSAHVDFTGPLSGS